MTAISWWVVGAIGVVVGGGVWLWLTASRLDRLHHRLDVAGESVHIQTARRRAAVLEIAGSGLLDGPESLLLVEAASAAYDDEAESRLSEVLRAVFDEPLATDDGAGRVLVDNLASACRRVQMARRFHNNQVASVRALRSTRLVRWFRLAGRAPHPQAIDLDDGVPPAFAGLDSGS